MPMPSESPAWIKRFSPYLEVVNTTLQIVALIAGGAWALWTWNQTSAPGLGTRLQVSGDLKRTWSEASQACVGELTVSAENIGQRNITVARAEYELVKAAPARLGATEKFKLIGTLPAESELLAKGEFSSNFVVHTYPPKVTSQQTLVFLLSAEQKEEVWYRVELFDADGESLGNQFGAIDACEREAKGKAEK